MKQVSLDRCASCIIIIRHCIFQTPSSMSEANTHEDSMHEITKAYAPI